MTEDGKISRRDFLKLAAAAAGGLGVNAGIGKLTGSTKPELPEGGQVLSTYEVPWQARPWVWVNLAIASSRLDGVKIEPGAELSVISALGLDNLDESLATNRDPRKGYVAAQMSNPFEISGYGYGLCLASTAIFRAALQAPVAIIERGTHYDIYSQYFLDMGVGTEAAVYSPGNEDDLPKTDLVLKNITNEPIKLEFKIFNWLGKPISVPDKEIPLVDYKVGAFADQAVRIIRHNIEDNTEHTLPRQAIPEQTFGNQRIFVKASFLGQPINYNVKVTEPVMCAPHTGSNTTNRSQFCFEREVAIGESGSQTKLEEKFVSQYGVH